MAPTRAPNYTSRCGHRPSIVTVPLPVVSEAQIRRGGFFIAFEGCEANRRKDRLNPGNAHLAPMHAYRMLRHDSTPGTLYHIEVPGAAETEAGWVPKTCSSFAPSVALILEGVDGPGSGGQGGASTSFAPNILENALAANWSPSFCATAAGQGKVEHLIQTPARPDARQFSIYDLWPDDDRREDTGVDPDEYFGETMALIEQLNRTPTRKLFEAHIGQVLTLNQVEQAFKNEFGTGVGERFQTVSRQHRNTGERISTALWISLPPRSHRVAFRGV